MWMKKFDVWVTMSARWMNKVGIDDNSRIASLLNMIVCNSCFRDIVQHHQNISICQATSKHLYLPFDFKPHTISCVVTKPVFVISDQVRHKLGCKATEDG